MMPSKDDCIKVAVRVRPQNDEDSDFESGVIVSSEASAVAIGERCFAFDNVFSQTASQSAIFEECVRPLIEGCLDGFNATIIAYGQTGSGKTYTMGTAAESVSGISVDSGIVPRAVELLFNRTLDAPELEMRVHAQFVELYNEEVRDLLDVTRVGKSGVKIHEGARGDIYLTGCTSRVVYSLEDTMRCLRDGCLARTTASTNMNSTSSRSHAVFTLFLRQKWKDSTGTVEQRCAKINFVDLAGSERMKRTGATGDRAREGIFINSGLLALGNVITALANSDAAGNGTHVPYRGSKLTRLLADSLGGNSQTLMVACASPAFIDRAETLSTLQYANRVKKIRNRATANREVLLESAGADTAALQARVRQLEDELAAMRRRQPPPCAEIRDAPRTPRATRRLWRDWNRHMLAADAEASQMKQLAVRSLVRRQVLDRVQRLARATADCGPLTEGALSRLEADLARIAARRSVCERSYARAVRKAVCARDRLRDSGPSAAAVLRSRVDLAERQAEHSQRLCRQLLAHTGACQRLVCAAMELLRREHLLLQSRGIAPPDLEARFAQLLAHFEGRRKVAWEDAAAEDGADCASLMSWTSDSTENSQPVDPELEACVPELPGAVFELRQRDLCAWLEDLVPEPEPELEPELESEPELSKTVKRLTPPCNYDLRNRASCTPLRPPVLVPSALNSTFDLTAEQRCQTSASNCPVPAPSFIDAPSTPPSQPFRPGLVSTTAKMCKTVTKKRPSDDALKLPVSKKLFRPIGGIVWANGLPLPVIPSPSRRPLQPLSQVQPASTRDLLSGKKSRRLSCIPLASHGPARGKSRRMTLAPKR